MGIVSKNTKLNENTYKLTICSKELACRSAPGQFVNIKCTCDDPPLQMPYGDNPPLQIPNFGESPLQMLYGEEGRTNSRAPQKSPDINAGRTGYAVYLRRPFGICDIDKTEGTVDIVSQVKGIGTRLMAGFKPGDSVDLLGPLGNGFDLSTVSASSRVAIVGGGTGVYPLLFLAKTLALNTHVREINVFLGYRERGVVALIDEFKSIPATTVIITSDDGSIGVKGLVTYEFERECKKSRVGGKDRYDAVFACGPEPMLASVARICTEYSIDGQLSVEQRMACGVGACLVCACEVAASGTAAGWGYKHVCKDGPVFRVGEVIFRE